LFLSVLCLSVTLLGPWYSCPIFSGFRISKMVYISLQTIESISTALSCSYLFLRSLLGPWYILFIEFRISKMVYISFRYEIDEEQIAAKLRGIDISLIPIC
jgi:hypothetical protein